MSQINDLKSTSLTDLGYTGTFNDKEYAWLGDQGCTVNQHMDRWNCYLRGLGYSGSYNDMMFEHLRGQGYTGTLDDMMLQSLSTGGFYGKSVRIQRNNDTGFCEYQPPDTVFCAASETYTALDFGFSGSPLSYSWSVTGGTAILSGSSIAQTCTVETQNSANDQTFDLTVTVSNTDPEEVIQVTTFTQLHTDSNVVPEYVGPNINDRDYVTGVVITPVDTFNLFTGTNLVFTLEGNWPTGLVIDSATGQITGTPVGAQQPYPDLTVKVTNSKGEASSTAFSITLTSSVVAPLFDNGPIPEQVWQIDTPIAQFPIGQFFLTGSFPRTYTIESGALPTGLTMNTAGQINGTPTVEGETGSAVIRCTNDAGFALTNDWSWLTWEAIATVGTIPDQSANVGTLFTHDYSQYFSGTVSGYVINAASWPPDTVFDTNTGIASFTPTAVFSHTGAVVVAESDYTPAFVVSNNFVWTVGAVVLPAFHAATFDPDTYEMQLQAVGVGTPTSTHTADLYAPDFEQVQRVFGEDEPVWSGGRVVKNYFVNSDNVLAQASSGDPVLTTGLPDPCGGNTAVRIELDGGSTSDIRIGGTANGTPKWDSTDVIGQEAVASYFVRATSLDAGTTIQIYNSGFGTTDITSSVDSTWKRFSAPKAVAGTTGVVRARVINGSIGDVIEVACFQLEKVQGQTNQNTSEYVENANTGDNEVVTKVFANLNGNTVLGNVVTEAKGAPLAEKPYSVSQLASTNYFLNSEAPVTQDLTLPAGDYVLWVIGTGDVNGTAEGAVTPVTSTGAAITFTVTGVLTHVQVEPNQKTGMIITEGTAVSTDEVKPAYDAGNHTDTAGSYYLDVDYAGADTDVLTVSGNMLSISGGNLILSDGSNSTQTAITAGAHKVGITYGESKMDLNIDGVWAGEAVYDGSFGIADIIQGETEREIQRIDITSYAEGKAWVDEQMGV